MKRKWWVRLMNFHEAFLPDRVDDSVPLPRFDAIANYPWSNWWTAALGKILFNIVMIVSECLWFMYVEGDASSPASKRHCRICNYWNVVMRFEYRNEDFSEYLSISKSNRNLEFRTLSGASNVFFEKIDSLENAFRGVWIGITL